MSTIRDVGVFRERVAMAWKFVSASYVYRLCILALVLFVLLWGFTGESRILWFGMHAILWASILESVRLSSARRRWAKSARHLSWTTSPVRLSIFAVAAGVLTVLGLAIIGWLLG